MAVWAARGGILCHEQSATWVRPHWATGELRPNEIRARAAAEGTRPRPDPTCSRGSDTSRAARGHALARATRWAALRLRARDESVFIHSPGASPSEGPSPVKRTPAPVVLTSRAERKARALERRGPPLCPPKRQDVRVRYGNVVAHGLDVLSRR